MNTHDKYELPPLPEPDAYLFQHEETGLTEYVDSQQVEWGFEKANPRWQKMHGAFTERQLETYAHAAIEADRKRIAELEAARIAYASEFAPDEDGNPCVGSIHENIRKLKSELETYRKRTTKQLAAYESLVASLEKKCTHMKKMYDELKVRTNPELLASERAANAILTAELEAVRKRMDNGQQPFGYFRPEPFGWMDCAATDDGAIALYERPQAQGEPVVEIYCRIYHDTEQHRDYLKARFHPDTWKNRVSFEWQGHRWAYRYTHFDDSGEYDLIARTAPQPAEQVIRNSRNTAEPVKVPSDTAILEVWQTYRDFPVGWICQFARDLLARYGSKS